jgi:hypothetical protein
MAANARRLVEGHYDWPAIGERLERIYRNLTVHATGADTASATSLNKAARL